MSDADRKNIEALAAQFFERADDLMMVSASIELVIQRRLALRKKLTEQERKERAA